MSEHMQQLVWADKCKRKSDALAQIWRETHRDFRGKIGGVKYIMVLRLGGSTLVPLASLSDNEVANRVKGYEA